MSGLQFCNRVNSAFVHLYVVRVHLSPLVFNIIECAMSNGFVPGVPSLDSPMRAYMVESVICGPFSSVLQVKLNVYNSTLLVVVKKIMHCQVEFRCRIMP